MLWGWGGSSPRLCCTVVRNLRFGMRSRKSWLQFPVLLFIPSSSIYSASILCWHRFGHGACWESGNPRSLVLRSLARRDRLYTYKQTHKQERFQEAERGYDKDQMGDERGNNWCGGGDTWAQLWMMRILGRESDAGKGVAGWGVEHADAQRQDWARWLKQ